MSERIGIAGGGAIASGLACVAAEHGQVVLWARRPDAATAKVEKLIEKRGGLGAGNVSISDDLDVAARRDVRRRGDRRGAGRQGGAAARPRRRGDERHDPRHHDVGAVDRRAGGGDRPAGALRRAARVQPGPEDGPDRARLPAAGRRRDARAGARAVRARSARPPSRCPTRLASSSTGCCSRSCSTRSRCSRRAGSSRRRSTTACAMGAGHPMGPLALLDYVGLDVVGRDRPLDRRRRCRPGSRR